MREFDAARFEETLDPIIAGLAIDILLIVFSDIKRLEDCVVLLGTPL
jgi:hypothetical protein